MTKRFDTVELSICDDCALLTANGECGENSDAHAAAMVEHLGEDVRHLVVACGEDWEDAFYTSQCGGCGSWLAGNRHAAVLLIPA